jgi:hypothetical protein
MDKSFFLYSSKCLFVLYYGLLSDFLSSCEGNLVCE